MSTNSTYVLTLTTIIRYVSVTINVVTLIIGTIGSICNLITFTAPQLRQSACVFYLLCATTFQLLSILFIVPTRMALDSFGLTLEHQSIIFCKIRYYFVLTLPELATLYMLSSIMDRCLATSDNVTVRAWSQLKIAHRLSVGILIVGFISNVHLLVFFTIYNDNCQTVPGSIYSLFIAGYTLIVIIVLPHILMLILSIITFSNMKRAKRRILPKSNVLHHNHHQHNIHRFETHIVMIIVLQVIVSSILLLLRIGSFMYTTLTSGNLNKTEEERTAEGFALQLGVSLYYFSFSISFYVSTLTSKYFRNIFWKRINIFYRCCCGQI